MDWQQLASKAKQVDYEEVIEKINYLLGAIEPKMRPFLRSLLDFYMTNKYLTDKQLEAVENIYSEFCYIEQMNEAMEGAPDELL